MKMRESCRECAQKHLMQACILLSEAHQGYPEHFFLAIGHMAEAADELVKQYPDLANMIREERLKLWEDRNYSPPFLEIVKKLDTLPETKK